MGKVNRTTILSFLVILGTLAFFSQGLDRHGIEYRDDEIFYYMSTAEMLQQGNWFSPTYFGQDRFQKPILFYWLVMLSHGLLGFNWFSARFVSVVFASLTAWLTWLLAWRMSRARGALLSCLILVTFPLFFRHAKNVVPDMALNFFVVLAMYNGFKFMQDQENRQARILFFTACALGFMTKGFAAVIIPFATIVLSCLLVKRPGALKKMNFPSGLVLIALIVLPWFIYMGFAHGMAYFHYMLGQETQDRLYNPDGSFLLFQFLGTFSRNSLFYLRVLASYFAPWSLFIPMALLFTIRRTMKNTEAGQNLVFLLVWFFSVFLFFSMISFRISHYILILSTPLAILIAHALLEGPYSVRPAFRRALKGFFIFLLAIGVFAVSFIFVFLAGMSNVWLVVYSCGVVAAAVSVFRSRDPLVPPGLLAFFLIFVLFQSNSISRTGLCPHAVYQRLAQAVHTEINPDYIVAVASHSLHEKEFQIHFDRQVVKTGHGYEPLTRVNLLNLLKDHPTVYCLITEADYNKYRLDLEAFPHEIIADALIFRKSLALDKGFIMAVARLDRARIQAYLMERILLMRKDPNALVR